jgi:HEAT repeat protein
MEKWYLKKTSDGRVTKIDKAISQESWLYDIKLAAQGKPQSGSVKQPIQPVEQNNPVVADKAYIQSIEKRVLTGWMRDSSQAFKAIEELGNIGDPDTVPTLLKALHLSPPMRIYAARALGEMGPKAKAAAPTLKSLINDQSYLASVFDQEFSKAIREEISKALLKIGQ